MADWPGGLLLGLYVAVSLGLTLYGLNCYALGILRLRSPPPPRDAPQLPDPAPRVTVQLPIYNERYVARRLLDAVARLDWPQDRLQVQVLDDSTDDTVDIVAALVEEHRGRGLDIHHVTRADAEDYKAGALQAGLSVATGEFVAVFDADFVPQADFLRRTIPHFADAGVACVQTRWGHVNRDYSWVTRALAVGIDGHFTVEQRVRSDHGLLLNFNGTAGVWRRAAIADAGGWSGDTLAEDLDLSYRAQMRGWRIEYLDEVACPAEIPAQIHAFKRQQARWAQGSIQCARKHLGSVLRHPTLSRRAKAEAVMHLTHYLVHPLLLALLCLLPPALLITRVPWQVTALFFIATFGPPFMYVLAQQRLHPGEWRRHGRLVAPLTVIGIGIAVSNTAAVFRGLTRTGGEFKRTPKFRIESMDDRWWDKVYALPMDATVYGEVAATVVSAVAVAAAVVTRHHLLLPWAGLFLASYGSMAWLSLRHHLGTRRREVAARAAALE